jgi:hypothetical protein
MWMGDEVNLMNGRERTYYHGGQVPDSLAIVSQGRFGGSGHREDCASKGPVTSSLKSGGIFNDPKTVDRCQECHQEIKGAH